MSVPHEDLVALALGNLDETEAERVRGELDRHPGSAAELEAVLRHLALHDRVEEIRPGPTVWSGIRERLAEVDLPRPGLRRYWMPAAAAALVLVALFFRRDTAPGAAAHCLHGTVMRSGADTWTSSGVARMRLGRGVVLTLDDRTTITARSEQRLALHKAGRVFFEVSESRRGFVVEAGDLSVRTAGTAFLVEWLEDGERRVWTESGRVLCRRPGLETGVAEGERLSAVDGVPRRYGAEDPRAWFRRPEIEARILAPDTIAVVVRNEMPDPIRLAPPTGGEPFFFASYGGRDHPLIVEGFDRPITLSPREERRFELGLPRPVADREALFVTCSALNVRVEATR